MIKLGLHVLTGVLCLFVQGTYSYTKLRTSSGTCNIKTNTDYYGADVGLHRQVQNPSTCCQLCFTNSKCGAWTYISSIKDCYLKKAAGWQPRPAARYVSGIKVKTAPRAASPPPSKQNPLISKYAQVLELSWRFYEAQRSGSLPQPYPVAWRQSSHLSDPIPGGWYDAGDYVKLNFPLAQTVSFLAWGLMEFNASYGSTGLLHRVRADLRVPVSYLERCHIEKRKYVGQIGDPNIDHNYWGRPEDQPGPRPAYVWDNTKPASDLLGSVAAALSSSYLVFKHSELGWATELLDHAKELWAWGMERPGKYSDSYPSATEGYESYAYKDDLMYGAAWLYAATGDVKYANAALTLFRQTGADSEVSWDSLSAPAAVLMTSLLDKGWKVPGGEEWRNYVINDFRDAWLNAKKGIAKTPKGLHYPSWSKWGNLRYSNNAAFMMLVHAKHAKSPAVKTANIAWAKSQVDYALGSSGRSYVVGHGPNYPLKPHHAASSCPSKPAACNWATFSSNVPNANILYGALVGGPAGPGDDTYNDRRDDYVTNEVAVDYNSGFTGALAGLVQMLK